MAAVGAAAATGEPGRFLDHASRRSGPSLQFIVLSRVSRMLVQERRTVLTAWQKPGHVLY